MRILGFVVIFLSILVAILASFTNLGNALPKAGAGLLDTACFICVVGSVIGGSLVAYGSELRTAFKANPSQEEAMPAINVYKLAVRVSIGSGFIGTQLGWIAMLGSMGGTGMDRAALTGGAATSLITILYGLTFAFCLFLPLQYYFQSKLDKDS